MIYSFYDFKTEICIGQNDEISGDELCPLYSWEDGKFGPWTWSSQVIPFCEGGQRWGFLKLTRKTGRKRQVLREKCPNGVVMTKNRVRRKSPYYFSNTNLIKFDLSQVLCRSLWASCAGPIGYCPPLRTGKWPSQVVSVLFGPGDLSNIGDMLVQVWLPLVSCSRSCL